MNERHHSKSAVPVNEAAGRRLWLDRDIHRDLLRLSIPTVISTLAVPLLGVVDTAVLGRLPDVAQLAGAAAAGVILSVVFQMFLSICIWRDAQNPQERSRRCYFV